MWNGALSPRVAKHRDYDHGTFFEHELDNGGRYETRPEWVMVDLDPITTVSLFFPSRRYYAVDFNLHTGEWYRFLVPAEADKSEPNRDNISRTLDQYFRNRIEGGRDWLEFLDREETPAEHLLILMETERSVPASRGRAVI